MYLRKITLCVLTACSTLGLIGAALFLNAHSPCDSSSFNVTLDICQAHCITVSDLDFGTINPTAIRGTISLITSNSRAVTTYCNCRSGYCVTISASTPEYLSGNGNFFILRGQKTGNTHTLGFYLQSSCRSDGTAAPGGAERIWPNQKLIDTNGSTHTHTMSVDIWACLQNTEEVTAVMADNYSAILTANHYTKN